jgi:hypothetical protein
VAAGSSGVLVVSEQGSSSCACGGSTAMRGGERWSLEVRALTELVRMEFFLQEEHTKNSSKIASRAAPRILKFELKSMELEGEIWGSSRSAPVTSDPWTKTTKNSTNSRIKFRAIFWDNFFGNFLGEIDEIGRGNLCSDTI